MRRALEVHPQGPLCFMEHHGSSWVVRAPKRSGNSSNMVPGIDAIKGSGGRGNQNSRELFARLFPHIRRVEGVPGVASIAIVEAFGTDLAVVVACVGVKSPAIQIPFG